MPKIHIDVSAELRQRLAVKAAYLQRDYSPYVAELIDKDTRDVVIPPHYKVDAKGATRR